MTEFAKRLRALMGKGGLAQGDLRWWFGRSYSTTASWLHGTRQPRRVAAGAEAWRRLDILEKAGRSKRGFPVPHHLSLTDRPHHIEKLYNDNSTGVSRKNTPGRRLQMR